MDELGCSAGSSASSRALRPGSTCSSTGWRSRSASSTSSSWSWVCRSASACSSCGSASRSCWSWLAPGGCSARFERLQAHYLLGADVGPAPRSWETVDGVWAKLKAHFGNGATWRDLAYLVREAAVRHRVVHAGGDGDGERRLAAGAADRLARQRRPGHDVIGRLDVRRGGSAVLGVPAAILMFFVWLHVLNGWGWVCARWAELLLRGDQASGGWQTELDQAQPAPSQPAPSQPAPSLAAGQPVVPPAAPQSEPSAAPQPPEPPAAPQPPVS